MKGVGLFIALLLAGSAHAAAAPAEPAPTYALIAKEGGTFKLAAPQVVRYGAGAKWTEKGFAAGLATACANSTFGDPFPNTVKRCEIRDGPPIELTPPPAVVMPAMLDHSQQGVTIDAKLLAAVKPAVGFAAPRVRTTWRHTDAMATDCAPGTAGCFVVDAEKPTPSDIGDFREPTDFAKFGCFDPIVNAGKPDAVSHCHTFLGNTCITAATTLATIAAPGCGSTSAGGSLNLSSYWFPTGVDTRTGQPLKPASALIYYKGSYEFDISRAVELMPVGLRVVAGNAKNTDPKTAAGRFYCTGPDGTQGPTANTIPGALVGGLCKKGGLLHFGVAFPYCWDGVNLDSPDHSSHVARPEDYIAVKTAAGDVVPSKAGAPGSYYAKRCPASHPRVIPTISYSLAYALTDDALAQNIRYASDLPGAEAGSSFHADYWMAWDVKTGQRWVDNCLRKNMDCHAFLLGDGFALY